MDRTSVGRRDFVVGALAGAGCLAWAGLSADEAAAAQVGRAKDRFHARIAAQVGTDFRLRSKTAGRATLELIETQEGRVTSREHARHLWHKPFSALFRRKRGDELPQETYHVSHPVLGTFDLFIVPVGSATGEYEAVFS